MYKIRFFIYVLLLLTASGGVSAAISKTDQNKLVSHFRFKELTLPALDLLGGQWATVQDRQGFIWFGGAGGVARFDGYELKHYKSDQDDPYSLSDNYVTDLLIADDGTLWVATLRGLNQFDAKNDRFVRYLHDEHDTNTLSHNWVWNIAQDSHGILWLATDGGGLVRFDHQAQKFASVKSHSEQANGLPSNNLLSVFVDSKDNVWIGTKDAGLSRYNPDTGNFKNYPVIIGDSKSLSHPKVNAIIEDNYHQIWVGTDAGLNRLDIQQSVFSQFLNNPQNPSSLSGNLVRGLLQDSQDNLWIATDGGGLSLYIDDEQGFKPYQASLGATGGLVNNKVRSIFEDNHGGLWFGHYPAGISQVDRYASAFTNYKHSPFKNETLSNSDVLAVASEGDNHLWVGTEGGLNKINLTTHAVERYVHDAIDPNSLPSNAVTGVVKDEQGNIWASTWGGGVGKLAPNTKHFKNYTFDSERKNSLPDNVIRTLFLDSKGVLWLGSGLGVSRYRPATDDFEHFTHQPNDTSSLLKLGVNTFYEDSRGAFWVGGDLGLQRFNRRTGAVERFEHNGDDPNSLLPGYVSAIGEDAGGALWIATGGNGVSQLKPDAKKFNHLTVNDGLADNRVGGILSDDLGYLWFATGRGLSRYNIRSGEFKAYQKEHGIAGNIFKRPTALKLKGGELVFGSTKGLTVFHPTHLASNTIAPTVAITGFELFNRPALINTQSSPLIQSIDTTEGLKLTHKQSVFSLTFSALDYVIPAKNTYAYKLEGFDKDWVMAGHRRTTTYTNLDAGHYRFRVRAANNEGVWNDDGDTLVITVLPAPWRTWWAYCLYILALTAFLAQVVYSQWRKLSDAREKIAMEHKVVERLEKLDRLKDDFLANTSHELRTPINGIIGLAETLMDGAAGPISAELKNNLNMISISGRRLAHLVNDILDFSKLKSQHIDVDIKPVDIKALAELVLTLCAPSTKGKELKLINRIPDALDAALADENRVQQIFYNLIGNAIKFTSAGAVEVSAYQSDDFIWVTIKDTGTGIPEDMLDKIFVPFEQVDDHQNRSQGGTGLGLTVTKQIVELMGGSVKVTSVVGRGSTFSFSLPQTHEPAHQLSIDAGPDALPVTKCLDLGGNDSTESIDGNLVPKTATQLIAEQQGVTHDNQRFKILIVDDDAINRKVLMNQLTLNNYQLALAESGAQALEQVENNGPFDLVLLDIMMPQMSGYEVCAHIRKYYSIQELPIIFLTAKNLISDLADGFELGANDFLTKPISIGELTSRVRTHLSLLDINRNLERRVKERTEEVSLANRELETLDNIVATIHQELRFDRLISVILNEAASLFGEIDKASYWHLDVSQSEFRLITHNQDERIIDQHSITQLPVEILESRYLDAKYQVSEFVYSLPQEAITALSSSDALNLTSDITESTCALIMPVILDEQLTGVLVLASNYSKNATMLVKPSTLERFRSHVISALNKSNLVDLLERNCNHLKRMSVTDQLTGLNNRRFLYDRIEMDIQGVIGSYSSGDHTMPKSADYNFFIIDIDHFKAINDTHGHLVGDKVLVAFAKLLTSIVRDSDYCVRWGGEEFLIITRLSSRYEASVMAEKIRSTIEAHAFKINATETIRCTCSIGFASFPFLVKHASAVGWEQILDVADICLYAAKSSQRNAWVGVNVNNPGALPGLLAEFVSDPVTVVSEQRIDVQSSITNHRIHKWKVD